MLLATLCRHKIKLLPFAFCPYFCACHSATDENFHLKFLWKQTKLNFDVFRQASKVLWKCGNWICTPHQILMLKDFKLKPRKLHKWWQGGGKYLYFWTKMLHSSARMKQGWNLRASLQSLGWLAASSGGKSCEPWQGCCHIFSTQTGEEQIELGKDWDILKLFWVAFKKMF